MANIAFGTIPEEPGQPALEATDAEARTENTTPEENEEN